MKRKILIKCLFAGIVSSVGTLADITVDTSNGMLAITSDISGTVIAKVIGPNDEVVVNEKYAGSSFTWVPSGVDGAYKYDVRVIPKTQESTADTVTDTSTKKDTQVKNDYIGGSVELKNGQIQTNKEEE